MEPVEIQDDYYKPNTKREPDEFIEGQLLESKPAALPQIAPKPGYKTSQGQLTVLFTIAALVMSFFGFRSTPESVENIYQVIQNAITVLGPILALIPVLINYINSRGKIQSNQLWASASLTTHLTKEQVELSSLSPYSPYSPVGFASGPLDGILGGKDWKDPKRYIDLGRILGSFGVPKIGKILDSIETPQSNSFAEQAAFNEEVKTALNDLAVAYKALDAKVSKLLPK